MKFGALQHQDKFTDGDLVLKKVSANLACDLAIPGDGRVMEFGAGQEVGDVLTDDEAQALLEGGDLEPMLERNPHSDVPHNLTPEDIRKMKRSELDELAKMYSVDLGDYNVEDSREYLIAEFSSREPKAN